MFDPRYRITGRVAKALMAIEADRQAVAAVPLSVRVLDSLRRSAKLLSTHLSTRIEGNRLSPSQVQSVVAGEGNFPGRERDEAEVRHYFAAVEAVETLGRKATPLSETELRTLHGLVMTGRAKPTRYRDGQNAVLDGRTGRVVYLPPEAKDVPARMAELVAWVNGAVAGGELPVPVVAALGHYQFATVHPYFDGNGRTARLLTNLVLHRGGYGLNGLCALEEYYAADLEGYYAGLAAGNSHNYYAGRAEADVTTFVAYFCLGMADAFAKVRARAEGAGGGAAADLRELSPQQRRALGLFLRRKEVPRGAVAAFFKLPPRRAYLLCARWLRDGFFVVANPSRKGRTYRLAAAYEERLSSGTAGR